MPLLLRPSFWTFVAAMVIALGATSLLADDPVTPPPGEPTAAPQAPRHGSPGVRHEGDATRPGGPGAPAGPAGPRAPGAPTGEGDPRQRGDGPPHSPSDRGDDSMRGPPRGGGGGSGGPGDRRPSRFRELTPEDVTGCVEVAEEINPELGAGLRKKLTEDPDALRRDLREKGRRLIGLMILRRERPELYQLKVAQLRAEAESEQLARRIRDLEPTDPAAAAQLKNELRERVRKQFDAELKARAEELAELDRQLLEFREELKNDSAERDKQVAEIMEQLLQGRHPEERGRRFDERGRRLLDRDSPPPPPPPAPSAPKD